MTDRTSEVIEAIDGALSDWSTSGDAMRWVPPEGRTAEHAEPVTVAPSFDLDAVTAAFDAAFRDVGLLAPGRPHAQS